MGRGHIFSSALTEKSGEPERCDQNNKRRHILMDIRFLEQNKILIFSDLCKLNHDSYI
jgi:hypothetical protein